MITAVFQADDLEQISSFTIKGHANYAKKNEYDLVCAAVSVLSQALVNGIEQYAPEQLACQVQDGFLSASLSAGQKEFSDRSQLLMKVLLDGLKDIAQSYPKCLSVSVERI